MELAKDGEELFVFGSTFFPLTNLTRFSVALNVQNTREDKDKKFRFMPKLIVYVGYQLVSVYYRNTKTVCQVPNERFFPSSSSSESI